MRSMGEEFRDFVRPYYIDVGCHSKTEYIKDVNRFLSIRKLLTKFSNTGIISIHPVQTNIQVLKNVLGDNFELVFKEFFSDVQLKYLEPFIAYQENRGSGKDFEPTGGDPKLTKLFKDYLNVNSVR